jgi:hypothetical protein
MAWPAKSNPVDERDSSQLTVLLAGAHLEIRWAWLIPDPDRACGHPHRRGLVAVSEARPCLSGSEVVVVMR